MSRWTSRLLFYPSQPKSMASICPSFSSRGSRRGLNNGSRPVSPSGLGFSTLSLHPPTQELLAALWLVVVEQFSTTRTLLCGALFVDTRRTTGNEIGTPTLAPIPRPLAQRTQPFCVRHASSSRHACFESNRWHCGPATGPAMSKSRLLLSRPRGSNRCCICTWEEYTPRRLP